MELRHDCVFVFAQEEREMLSELSDVAVAILGKRLCERSG